MIIVGLLQIRAFHDSVISVITYVTTQTHTGGPATSCVVLRMMCFEDVLSAESFLIQHTCRMCYVMLICTSTREQRDTMAGGQLSFRPITGAIGPLKAHLQVTRGHWGTKAFKKCKLRTEKTGQPIRPVPGESEPHCPGVKTIEMNHC